MSIPNWICVEIEGYLKDNPPWDIEIPSDLITEIAATIARDFDYTSVYNQIDRLGCRALRERGLDPTGEDNPTTGTPDA